MSPAARPRSVEGARGCAMLAGVGELWPDPLTADRVALDRVLVELQRRYGVASHVVAERPGEVPAGVDEATLRWWRYAWATRRRRFGW